MYDELVKRLRTAKAVVFKTEDMTLLGDAADAIEELSRAADAIPHVCECCIGCEVESGGCDNAFVLSPKRAKEYLSKPRWIPVTERLPEQEKQVLVTGIEAICNVQIYGVKQLDRDVWRPISAPSCYWEHWMPLPEPPKEER